MNALALEAIHERFLYQTFRALAAGGGGPEDFLPYLRRYNTRRKSTFGAFGPRTVRQAAEQVAAYHADRLAEDTAAAAAAAEVAAYHAERLAEQAAAEYRASKPVQAVLDLRPAARVFVLATERARRNWRPRLGGGGRRGLVVEFARADRT